MPAREKRLAFALAKDSSLRLEVDSRDLLSPQREGVLQHAGWCAVGCTMNRTELERLFAGIAVWKRGDERAVNKPLLLLLALGRCAARRPREVLFSEVEPTLTRLLREFGPPRVSVHPEYPFWRLQADGLWELSNAERVTSRASNTDAKKSELLRYQVGGGFPISAHDLLARHPDLIVTLAQDLLDAHFPESYHYDIAEAVGLDLSASASRAASMSITWHARTSRTRKSSHAMVSATTVSASRAGRYMALMACSARPFRGSGIRGLGFGSALRRGGNAGGVVRLGDQLHQTSILPRFQTLFLIAPDAPVLFPPAIVRVVCHTDLTRCPDTFRPCDSRTSTSRSF